MNCEYCGKQTTEINQAVWVNLEGENEHYHNDCMMKVFSEEKSQTSKQDYLKIISHTYNMTCPFCAKLVVQIPIVTYVNDFGNESVYHPVCYEAAFGVSAEVDILDPT